MSEPREINAATIRSVLKRLEMLIPLVQKAYRSKHAGEVAAEQAVSAYHELRDSVPWLVLQRPATRAEEIESASRAAGLKTEGLSATTIEYRLSKLAQGFRGPDYWYVSSKERVP